MNCIQFWWFTSPTANTGQHLLASLVKFSTPISSLCSHYLCLRNLVQVATPGQNLMNKHLLAKLSGPCWGFFVCMYYPWTNTTVCSVHFCAFISGCTLNFKSGQGKGVEMDFQAFIMSQTSFQMVAPTNNQYNNFWCTFKYSSFEEDKHNLFKCPWTEPTIQVLHYWTARASDSSGS